MSHTNPEWCREFWGEAAEYIDEIEAERDRLADELETERMRLAACGVAALGYFDWCKDEYRSASLDDTLRLYEKADRLAAENAELVKALDDIEGWGSHTLELAVEHGSNGVRDFYRSIAREALAKVKESA